MNNKIVEIYSTPTCHFCHLAKDWLNEKGIKFTDYNVATDLEKRKEAYLSGEKKSSEQKAIDRLRDIEFAKEEAHSQMIRNWVMGVVVVVAGIFWWVSRSDREMS